MQLLRRNLFRQPPHKTRQVFSGKACCQPLPRLSAARSLQPHGALTYPKVAGEAYWLVNSNRLAAQENPFRHRSAIPKRQSRYKQLLAAHKPSLRDKHCLDHLHRLKDLRTRGHSKGGSAALVAERTLSAPIAQESPKH